MCKIRRGGDASPYKSLDYQVTNKIKTEKLGIIF